jgi:hypothetical protein
LESLINDKDDAMHRTIESTERQVFDKLRKIQLDVQASLELQEQKLKEVYNNSFQDVSIRFTITMDSVNTCIRNLVT